MSACIGQQAHAHALMCLRFRAIVRLCELSQQERKHMEWRAHAAKHEFSHKTVARRREVFPRTCLKQPMCCWRGDKKRDRHHFWEQMEMGNNVCCWIRLDVNGLMGTIFTPLPSLKSSPPKFLLIHRKTKVSWGHAEIVFHRLYFLSEKHVSLQKDGLHFCQLLNCQTHLYSLCKPGVTKDDHCERIRMISFVVAPHCSHKVK